jgi:uncharacterized protein YdaU (DUF1376 family)
MAKFSHLPFMPFHIDRYQGDPKVQSLSQGEHGSYGLLLQLQWKEGHIGKDRGIWYAVTKARTDEEKANTDRVISLFFKANRHGNYFNTTNETIRTLHLGRKKRLSAAGKKGAIAKHLSGQALAPLKPGSSHDLAIEIETKRLRDKEKKQEHQSQAPKKQKSELPPELKEIAIRVLAAMDQSRREFDRQAPLLVPTTTHLRPIVERLSEGHTEDECMHVVAVCRQETDGNKDQFQFFSPAFAFSPKSFSVKAAMRLKSAQTKINIPTEGMWD